MFFLSMQQLGSLLRHRGSLPLVPVMKGFYILQSLGYWRSYEAFQLVREMRCLRRAWSNPIWFDEVTAT